MTQDEHYLQAIAEFGPALGRLARAYEGDADQRRDLLQDIHLALWELRELCGAMLAQNLGLSSRA